MVRLSNEGEEPRNPRNDGPYVSDADRIAAESFADFLRPVYRLTEFQVGQLAIEFAACREQAEQETRRKIFNRRSRR